MQHLGFSRSPPPSPSPSSTCASLLISHHILAPLSLESTRGREIAFQNPLHVLIDGHLPAVEALQPDNLSWVSDKSKSGWLLNFGVPREDLPHAGPSHVLAIKRDDFKAN